MFTRNTIGGLSVVVQVEVSFFTPYVSYQDLQELDNYQNKTIVKRIVVKASI